MNILFISPTYSGAGGIGPHAFRVAEKLREIGYNIELMHVPHIPIKNLKNLSFSLFGTIKGILNKNTKLWKSSILMLAINFQNMTKRNIL